MGLFSSGKKSGFDPDGSKGKHGRGYGKGSANSNPDKYKARTEAQHKRAERQDRTRGRNW